MGSRAHAVRDQTPYGFVMWVQEFSDAPDTEGTADRYRWYPRPTWPVGPGICETSNCDYFVVADRRWCGWCLLYDATGLEARDADVELALGLNLL